MNRPHDRARTKTLLALAVAMLCLTLPLSAKNEARIVQATMRDLNGVQFHVPAKTRTTLVLFLRNDKDQSDRVLKNAAAAMEDLPPVQVLVVLSGRLDSERAKKFAAGVTWPVIPDPAFKLFGTLHIRVWPSTVVVLPDGRELTRLSGVPQSYVRDLNAYLAFAAKKIDRKTLDRTLATSDVVTDGPRQMAKRHLLVARRLLGRGQVKSAQQELEMGLKLLPEDPHLLLAKARTLLLLNGPREAIAVLDGLDEKSSLAGGIGALRGWALVELAQWDHAIRVLRVAVKLHPAPSEAYYFLGLAYERKAMPAEAARAYRAAFEATRSGASCQWSRRGLPDV